MSKDCQPLSETPGKTPVSALPARDYGAQTLRNYRYQSAYAVVLLVGAAAKRTDYNVIWCEQEDDILCEITDAHFDAFQVKTQTPELGYWRLTDDAFVTAVKNCLRIEN